MAKFCGKCGANIEDAVAFCPNCGQRLKSEEGPEKNEIKPKKTCEKSIKKANKKKCVGLRIAAVFLIMAVLTSAGLGVLVYFDVVDVTVGSNTFSKIFPKTSQKLYATKIVNAFEHNDMSSINNIIFDNVCVMEENIGITFEHQQNADIGDNSMLKAIFSETRLSLIKVENGTFIYEIEAPKMVGVFSNIEQLQTEEELLGHIEQFAKSAEKEETKVVVPFTESNGRYTANYKSEEFINAITGGLVNEYKNIITQYMEEIVSKGVAQDETMD